MLRDSIPSEPDPALARELAAWLRDVTNLHARQDPETLTRALLDYYEEAFVVRTARVSQPYLLRDGEELPMLIVIPDQFPPERRRWTICMFVGAQLLNDGDGLPFRRKLPLDDRADRLAAIDRRQELGRAFANAWLNGPDAAA